MYKYDNKKFCLHLKFNILTVIMIMSLFPNILCGRTFHHRG